MERTGRAGIASFVMRGTGYAVAIFADNGPAGNASEVQHTMDNYADLLLMSCWPVCLQ